MSQKPIKLITYTKAGTDNILKSPYLEYPEQYDNIIDKNMDKLAKIYERLKYLFKK